MGYKIAVIIVIFWLIAGLVVNILLLQNEKQYSIKSCSVGFRAFCFISLVLFAHKVPLLYLFFEYQSALGCQSAHWQASVEAATAESLEYLTAALFWLPRYLYCLFLNSSTLLSDSQSGLNGSYPIGRGLLHSALLSPVHSEILPKISILHSIHIVYVLFWHE